MWVKLTHRNTGLPALTCLLQELRRARGDVVVDRLHPLLGERAGVLDLLRAVRHCAQLWITPRGPKFLRKLGKSGSSLGIVRQFRFLLGVEVIEIAVELVEAVHGRQHLVLVAEMVLAELAGGVALRLEQFGDGRVFLLQPEVGAGQTRPW